MYHTIAKQLKEYKTKDTNNKSERLRHWLEQKQFEQPYEHLRYEYEYMHFEYEDLRRESVAKTN